ncbi:hypothetical protein ASZ78_014829 [Callipepla squamata]|uniref:Prolyl endopeptidase-like n=1 Tax=Callipepla squamata TaxID=9009 RepID=A0A226ND86_CALSU|nr:hypothetical protein ASZ78_014829 [Callipepla squamata]
MLLHELGFSQPKYTALTAASAGGVLAGAICNRDPELIRAVVLQNLPFFFFFNNFKAPFVDVLNTMMKTQLPLSIEEQEEWGNPLADERCMKYIESYCPYHNIKPQHMKMINEYHYQEFYDMFKNLGRLLKTMPAEQERKCQVIGRFVVPGNGVPNIILDIQASGSHCDSSWEDSLHEVCSLHCTHAQYCGEVSLNRYLNLSSSCSH